MEEINESMTGSEAPMSEEEPSPLVETSVTVDGALQARLMKKMKILGLLGVVLGPVLLLFYIVASTVFETLAEEQGFVIAPWLHAVLQVALYGGAILLVIGLVLFIGARSSVKNVKTAYHAIYRFYEGYVVIETERQGEEISRLKLYYADLVKVKENKQFFFLNNTATTAFIVEKSRLTPEEIGTLKRILPIK